MGSRIYTTLVVIIILLVTYTTGLLSGYVIGYNDKFAKEIVAYRLKHKILHHAPRGKK